MSTLLHLRIAGVLLMLLAASHLWFPRKFGWKADLASLTLLNRQIFLVHAFFITVVVLFNGLLFALWPHLLLERSTLGDLLMVGIGLFWLCRLAIQFFGYDPRLWRGHPTNTAIHVGITGLWVFLILAVARALA